MSLYVDSGYIGEFYTLDDVVIFWDTKIIFVPKNYLTPTANPNIFNLDTDTFRLKLKDLEDGEIGISYPDTHQHNTEVPLGGVIYARVIEIINGYTVTFENGQYSVNLFGSNNNIGDVVNVNNVSVRTNNAAGLIVDPGISESLDYGEHIIYNEDSGSAGSTWPTGTYADPVNNCADLQLLLNKYGRSEVLCLSDITLTQDFHDVSFVTKTGEENFYANGFKAQDCNFNKFIIQGDFNHSKIFASECSFNNVENIGGTIFSAILFGDIKLSTQFQLVLNKCSSTKPGLTPVYIDMVEGVDTLFGTRGHSGPLEVGYCDTSASTASIIFEAGNIILNPTCDNGNIVLGGIASVLDNSTTGCTVNITGVIDPDTSNTIAYNGMVSIQSGTTNTGTSFPIGTNGIPVNNLADAITIAVERGIDTLHIHGDWIFTNGTFLDDFTIEGDSLQKSNFRFETGAIMLNCVIKQAKVSGDITGMIGFDNCHLYNIGSTNQTPSSQDILVNNCLMDGIISLTPAYSGEIRIINCKSAISGIETPEFNISNSNSKISFRDYSGGMELTNSNQSGFTASIDMNSGNVIINETVSSGTITVRGISNLMNNSTGSAIIKSTGLVEPERINTLAYDNVVHIMTGSTITGTTFPAGTSNYPVNNLTDAIVIGNNRGINNIHIIGNYTFNNGTYVSNLIISGEGSQTSTFTFESGCVLAFCEILDAKCTGAETGIVGFTNCLLEDLGSVGLYPSSVEVITQNCYFKGTITLPNNYSGQVTAVGCWALPDILGNPPVINMGNSTADVQIRNWSGLLEFKNVTNPVNIRAFFLSGGIILDESVTAGDFLFAGVGNLTNNSTNVTKLDSKGLVSGKVIEDTYIAVEALRPHHTGFGKIIYWDPLLGNDLFNGTEKSLAVSTFIRAHELAGNGAHDTIIALASSTGQLVVDEHITITKNYLFLRGPGRDFLLKPTISTGHTITINALGVEVSGMVVETSSDGAYNAFQVNSGAHFFLIENVWSHFASDMAVYAMGGIDYGRINDCFFNNMNGHGIYLNGNVTHTKITDTEINNSGGDGILIEGTTANNNIIGDNVRIYGGSAYGVRIAYPTTRTFISLNASIYANVLGKILDNGINTQYGEADIASAVWDEPLVNHVIDGTTGRILSLTTFDSKVWMDDTIGVTGTTFPIGTKSKPSSFGLDALIIAERENIKEIKLNGTFTSTQSVSGYTIGGDTWLDDTFILSGTSYDYLTFKDLYITGTPSSFGDNIQFKNCYIKDITNLSGEMIGCRIKGNISVASGQTLSGVAIIAEGDYTTIDLQGVSGTAVSLDIDSGYVMFINSVEGCLIEINLKGGEIELDSSCTGGEVYFEGIGTLYGDPEALGMTVKANNLIDNTTISSAVWDTTLSAHTSSGSTGEALESGGGSFTGNTQEIADAVWDTMLSAHTISGSAGEELASGGSFTGNTEEIAIAVWNVLTSSVNADGSFGVLMNELINKANESQHTLNVQTEMLKNKPNNC